MKKRIFPHNNTPESVVDSDTLETLHYNNRSIGEGLEGSLCYHTLQYYQLAEVIKKYSNPSREVIIRDIIDDIFGDFHKRYHTLPFSGITKINLKHRDYWNPYDKLDESLIKLLDYSEIGSASFLDAALTYALTSRSVGSWGSMDLFNNFLSQPKLDKNMLLKILLWIIPPGDLFLETYPENGSGYRRAGYLRQVASDFLPELFNHSLFPVEKLLEYCGHQNPIIRKIAAETEGCPREGQIMAAMLGKA